MSVLKRMGITVMKGHCMEKPVIQSSSEGSSLALIYFRSAAHTILHSLSEARKDFRQRFSWDGYRWS